jgi:uncharacterized protein
MSMTTTSMASRRRVRDARSVFVDAAAWIALINRRDDLSARAWQVMRDLQKRRTRLVTTEFVLLEVADALSAPALRANAVAYVELMRRFPYLTIIPADSELFAAGWTLYAERTDKEWSLTDCISFAVMTERRITDAFTSDHHFEQAGFHKLL